MLYGQLTMTNDHCQWSLTSLIWAVVLYGQWSLTSLIWAMVIDKSYMGKSYMDKSYMGNGH